MSGGADGNLSDSSSAVSGLSLRDGNNQGQLVNHNLNLSTSSTDGDILTFGRSGYYKGDEFKAVIGKVSLAYPCYDSLVPSSMDQVPMKEEVVEKKVPRKEVARKEEISISDGEHPQDLDRTSSFESLIGALEKEENRSPNTDRKLEGLKEAFHYKKRAKLSTKQAVSLVSVLSDLSPGNSPVH